MNSLQHAQRQQYLDDLQRNTTVVMIPSMVYLCLLSVTGLVGNSLVLYVYSCKFSSSPIRTFIVAAAVFDLLTNTVVIPADIYDMLHAWDFEWPLLCQARRYFNASTTLASAILLVAISVARYRKICRPFGRQVNIREAKIICGITLAVSLTCCFPYAIMNGSRRRHTHIPGVDGHFCAIDDYYVTTKWPLVNSAFFTFIYLICCVPLVVLYALIGSKAFRQRSFRRATLRLIVPRDGADAKETNDSSISQRNELIPLPGDSVTTASKKDDTNLPGSDVLKATVMRQSHGQTVLVCESATLSRIWSLQNDSGDNRDRSSVILLRKSSKRGDESVDRVKTVYNNSYLREEQYVKFSNTEESQGTKHVILEVESRNRDDGTRQNSEVINTNDASSDECVYEICGVVSASESSTDVSSVIREDDPTPTRPTPMKDSSFTNTTISTSLGDSLGDCFMRRPDEDVIPHRDRLSRSLVKTSKKTKKRRASSDKSFMRSRRRIDPTSCMLLLISVVFVCCFLPFVCLEFFKAAAPDVYASMDEVSTSLYQLFWRSYLLNSAANPIIYLMCDLRFRKECLRVLSC